MAGVLSSGHKVCKFKLQSHYYVHFRTNPLRKSKETSHLSAMGEIMSLLFFYKEGFDMR